MTAIISVIIALSSLLSGTSQPTTNVISTMPNLPPVSNSIISTMPNL